MKIRIKYYYLRLIVISICCLNVSWSLCSFQEQNVAVIGTGYVGLISGACLADFGHQVICCDIDEKKVNALSQGEIPIFELNIEEVVRKNICAGRLLFTCDIKKAIELSDIIIIAVGTPMQNDGNANLSALHAVLDSISTYINNYKVVCIKSTVPIGTNAYVKDVLKNKIKDNDLSHNAGSIRN